nr:acyl carrier protein [Maliibacterium massiliense]
MAEDAIFGKVRAAIVKQMGCEDAAVTMESSLVDDLKADSLDIVELIFNLEEAFNITIAEEDEEDLEHMATVGDIVAYIQSRI